MKFLKNTAIKCLLALSICSALIAPAYAETMRWTIDTTGVTDDIQFQLYSQWDDEQWPSSERVWAIDVMEYENTYTIECVYEEPICFGAWVTGNTNRYWGVGFNDRYNAPGNCHTCGFEKNVTVTLTD